MSDTRPVCRHEPSDVRPMRAAPWAQGGRAGLQRRVERGDRYAPTTRCRLGPQPAQQCGGRSTPIERDGTVVCDSGNDGVHTLSVRPGRTGGAVGPRRRPGRSCFDHNRGQGRDRRAQPYPASVRLPSRHRATHACGTRCPTSTTASSPAQHTGTGSAPTRTAAAPAPSAGRTARTSRRATAGTPSARPSRAGRSCASPTPCSRSRTGLPRL